MGDSPNQDGAGGKRPPQRTVQQGAKQAGVVYETTEDPEQIIRDARRGEREKDQEEKGRREALWQEEDRQLTKRSEEHEANIRADAMTGRTPQGCAFEASQSEKSR